MSDITQSRRAHTAANDTVMTHRMIMFVIFGLMAGMFLSALDQTVVGTAIRTIGDDLQGLSLQAWVTTAYLIVSTISTPIYGKLSDIFGRRPLFLIAIVIFIIGSILASFAQSMVELAAFRAIQGLGAGGLMSMPLAIMGDILAPRERAKYQGYFLAVFGISSVIGPLVGGLFSGASEILFLTGWRWVFLINVPIGIVALAIVWRFLHIPKQPRHSVRIDWWGATTVIVALVPLLLVAEQGREWGWGSPIALACYVVGALGILAFVIAETKMKDDALIPLKLFRSPTFSMATVIGVLVGFGMFGAMLTLPLYLQLVLGSNPTQSGFEMLPMILGLMIASIASGQLIARTGRYRMFPILGTLLMSVGFFLLTFLKYDSPYWHVAIAMLVIGLGLGQLMQTLTIASQNSVGVRDMGVATSGSTFFRQIGGTLGTAVLLSLLFTLMPSNIIGSFSDRATLTDALDAAFDPATASAPANEKIMSSIYTPIVTQTTDAVTQQVQQGLQQAEDAATQAVAQQVAAGQIPASAQAQASQAAVSQAIAAATTEIQQQVPVARVAADGTVSLDFSDADDRAAFVDTVATTLTDEFTSGDQDTTIGGSTLDDTSFLVGADPRLTKPFLVGFNSSATSVYWVAMGVVLLAFVLSLFFRTPPLRAKSALQEAADERRGKDDEEKRAAEAATQTGALLTP
ncbi:MULTISPECIES: MDR family MFS transporter [Microbacterium]|uniref:MDR family MFS transporter n=1 Tax=Microbacterium TaxID=33882 RepID=UPI00278B0DE7|nr:MULTISPECIES: MDR family MFS transporter [Microbacterium]MDQ1082796.1 EmrB/QacA subfamily drug resistance transporter [Microbacterium sp. SORGH_AS_0344]MDQ1168434.1 EmrB/QacA subfamily drug resistance transporter [Microbacterium proteolyticum]